MVGKFSVIEKRAAKRKGGAAALEELLPDPPVSKAKLSRSKDDRWLSAMAKVVFASGFRWKVVDAKWPDIEEAFGGFDIGHVASLGESEIAELVTDKRVIRHKPKIESIRDNARFVISIAEEAGSFGKYVSRWPDEDLIGLWADLKSRGERLGGMTGPRMLRSMGKDSFLLTGDVVKCLIGAKVVAKNPTSKKDLRAVQDAFNAWKAETGRPFNALSRIAACSVP